jgi:hypothetical protein
MASSVSARNPTLDSEITCRIQFMKRGNMFGRSRQRAKSPSSERRGKKTAFLETGETKRSLYCAPYHVWMQNVSKYVFASKESGKSCEERSKHEPISFSCARTSPFLFLPLRWICASASSFPRIVVPEESKDGDAADSGTGWPHSRAPSSANS